MDLVALAAPFGVKLDTNGGGIKLAVEAVVEDARDVGAAGNVEVGTGEDRRRQEGCGHGRALAAGVNEGLEAGDTEGAVGGVDVLAFRDAGVDAGGQEAVFGDGLEVGVAGVPLAVGTAVAGVNLGPQRVGGELFHAAEVGREVVVGPAVAAVDRLPLVKVGVGAVVVHHGIDGGRAAQHAAAGPVHAAVGEAGLLDRVVVPVVLGVEELGEEDGHLGLEHVGVGPARLEEEYADVLVLGELAGEDAARGAGADNDCQWIGQLKGD